MEKNTRYVGCVTDELFNKSLLRSSDRFKHKMCINENKYDWKYEEALDFIFSVGRLPRYYKN